MPGPIRRYRVIAESHDSCVNPHGVVAIEDSAGVLCYVADHLSAISKLTAAHDAMLKERDALDAANTVLAARYVKLQSERDNLAGIVLDVTQERDAARKERAWISCSERMPTRADGQVLGWAPGHKVGNVWLSDSPPDCKACENCPKGAHLHGALSSLSDVWSHTSSATHWMPLPAPPTPGSVL